MLRRYLISLCALGALWQGLAAAPALAQAPVDPAKLPIAFLNWLETPAYFEFLTRKAIELEPAPLALRCTNFTVLRRQGWAPVELPVWSPDKGQPVSGSWIERLVVDRCGETTLRRLLVSGSRTQDEPFLSALAPGGTLANLRLERATLPLLTERARREFSCSDSRKLIVIETKVTQLPDQGSWSERWTAIACDQPLIQDIRFTPGRDGTEPLLLPME